MTKGVSDIGRFVHNCKTAGPLCSPTDSAFGGTHVNHRHGCKPT